MIWFHFPALRLPASSLRLSAFVEVSISRLRFVRGGPTPWRELSSDGATTWGEDGCADVLIFPQIFGEAAQYMISRTGATYALSDKTDTAPGSQRRIMLWFTPQMEKTQLFISDTLSQRRKNKYPLKLN